jgi:transposase
MDDWLVEAGCCGVRVVESITSVPHQECTAVHAALTSPRSIGQAEDRITTLKMMKQQMYG